MRFYAALGAIAVGGLVVGGTAASSSALDGTSIDFTPPSTTSVEYGSPWSFTASGTWNYYMSEPYLGSEYTATTTVSGAPDGYLPQTYGNPMDAYYKISVYVAQSANQPPLTPGDYDLSLTIAPLHGPAEATISTPTPARLTITAAALDTRVRVIADPGAKDAAIITADFTGAFAEDWYGSSRPEAAGAPAGTWHLIATAADGTVALDQTIDTDGSARSLATTYYWQGAPPSTDYSVVATFAPSGASAENFEVGAGPAFAYTSFDEQRPLPTPAVTAAAEAPTIVPVGPGIPFWALLGIIVAALASVATSLVFFLRARAATTPSVVESEAP